MTYLGEFEQLILFSVLELGEEAYGLAIREHERATRSRRGDALRVVGAEHQPLVQEIGMELNDDSGVLGLRVGGDPGRDDARP